ncbi:hypothetical protein [Neokomagataea anthophila]|uniref:Uncharacterized protein n=1 Tax=Neokomagataea anthophila TaxID=2826925 RepID=A0ABS5EA35_9PROT|nr:hypothetical protein [Neokomagataea anthophila]MBR0560734.1 hypothetical protein [Neokomagataea anthophila]
MNRLFRQDRLIALNTIRVSFAGWHERAIAAFILLVALAVTHAWFAGRPWRAAAWTGCAACTVIGIGAGRLVNARLAFHAFDGLLAADALSSHTCGRYRTAWHGVGLTLMAVATMIVRPALLGISMPAYLTGVLIAGLTGSVRVPKRIAGTARPGWTLRAFLHRPVAGVATATILLLLLLLLPVRTIGTNALMAVVGISTMLFALTLTGVDDAFRTRVAAHFRSPHQGALDLLCRVGAGMLDHARVGRGRHRRCRLCCHLVTPNVARPRLSAAY